LRNQTGVAAEVLVCALITAQINVSQFVQVLEKIRSDRNDFVLIEADLSQFRIIFEDLSL
jgi:hypothetical protein